MAVGKAFPGLTADDIYYLNMLNLCITDFPEISGLGMVNQAFNMPFSTAERLIQLHRPRES
ncbi:hypothetical protein D0466_11965 [Peribacillus glennii]|uniref:Uncharacterized protein n=1 Tax=Peribacillus glennii TaxID=2303991 RepID=A0A372LC25_9BACI|nr:hypothetical protein D0466_11965 [Peribacillus glennii]